jgi:cysteinyl-tRNA synthetase
MHHGFIVDGEGEKMSKSLGNVDSLVELAQQYDPRAYRMLLLQAHYRGPVTVSRDNLDASAKAVARVDGIARRFPHGTAAADESVLDEFRRLMDDDLNTTGAMGLMFDAVTRANAAADAGDQAAAEALAAAVREIARAVGLELHGESAVPAHAQATAQALDQARAAKDFATADRLRGELQADGWTVETTRTGTTLRR